MGSEFLSVTIGECCEITTGFPFKSAYYTDRPEGIRLVRGDNIVQGSLRWDGVKRWDPEDLDKVLEAKYSLREDDIVLAMDRPWIEAGLKYSSIGRHDLPSLLVQRVARLRANSGVEQRLLKYIIGGREFTNHVLSVQTGTAVPHISSKQIAEYSFSLPPRVDQKVIAHILGTLDDKIELNRKTNETLDGIAKALFKSWFVDFDPVRARAEGRPTGLPEEIGELFPDSFEDSELGEIPSGWSVAEIGDLLDLEHDSVAPTDSGEEIFDHYSIPAFDDGQIPAVEAGRSIKSNKYLVTDGVFMVSKLNPRFPRSWIPSESISRRGICSTEFLVCRPKVGIGIPFAFYLSTSNSVVRQMSDMASGTSNSHQRIRPSDFLGLPFVRPASALLNLFSDIVSPTVQKHLLIRDQNQALSKCRDALLPKLISGELRVPDAEKMIEEVGI